MSLRDGDWKLLANAGLNRFELYNVADDQGEKTDLAAREPERVKRMAIEMKRLHQDIQAEGKRSGNPPPHQPKK